VGREAQFIYVMSMGKAHTKFGDVWLSGSCEKMKVHFFAIFIVHLAGLADLRHTFFADSFFIWFPQARVEPELPG